MLFPVPSFDAEDFLSEQVSSRLYISSSNKNAANTIAGVDNNSVSEIENDLGNEFNNSLFIGERACCVHKQQQHQQQQQENNGVPGFPDFPSSWCGEVGGDRNNIGNTAAAAMVTTTNITTTNAIAGPTTMEARSMRIRRMRSQQQLRRRRRQAVNTAGIIRLSLKKPEIVKKGLQSFKWSHHQRKKTLQQQQKRKSTKHY